MFLDLDEKQLFIYIYQQIAFFINRKMIFRQHRLQKNNQL